MRNHDLFPDLVFEPQKQLPKPTASFVAKAKKEPLGRPIHSGQSWRRGIGAPNECWLGRSSGCGAWSVACPGRGLGLMAWRRPRVEQ